MRHSIVVALLIGIGVGACFISSVLPPRQSEKESDGKFYDQMKESVTVKPWPKHDSDSKNVYVVKHAQEVGETGIKLVIVEDKQGGYLISAFSGREHEIGSEVELVVIRHIQGSNQERKTTLMIK